MAPPTDPSEGNYSSFHTPFFSASKHPVQVAVAAIEDPRFFSPRKILDKSLPVASAHNMFQGVDTKPASASSSTAYSSNHPQRQWDPAILLNSNANRKARDQQALMQQSFPPFQPFSSSGMSQPMNPVPTQFQFSDLNGFSNPPTPVLQSSAVQGSATPMPIGLMGSMIEQMNNVQDRSTVPVAKRRKVELDVDEERPKNGFHSASSGILSGYIKQKQHEKQSTPSLKQDRPTLDLTGGDDAENTVQDPREQEVCYGMISQAQAQCHIVPSPKPGTKALSPNSWPQVKVMLSRIDGDRNMVINVKDHTRVTIGKLNDKVARALAPLLDSRRLNLRTDAMIGVRTRRPGEEAGQPTSSIYSLQIMLYGKAKFARTVGQQLAEHKLGLSSPTRVDKGIRVYNPLPTRMNYTVGAPKSYDPPVAPPAAPRTEEEVRAEVFKLFDSLPQSDQLPESEPDEHIVTPLLHHQKQALYFMKNREDPSEMLDQLWKKTTDARGQVSYHNVITNQRTASLPAKAQGGILADMMGLGKTLSTLSLIASSSSESLAWALTEPVRPQTQNQQNHDSFRPPRQDVLGLTQVKKNSKATLLICPLSTITNWEEQIKQHIRPGSLTYHIYHGPNRIKDLDQLMNFDLVITTYGSVSAELSARSANKRGPHPLEEIGWFRIVLDEAHMIREQSTLQFKAICRLQASRRWAVTGTPVQNKLDDLGSLMAFLRVRPFHDRSMFNQYIVTPFKLCDEGIIPKLRLLVDTITIRRMKDKIDLPPRHDQTIKLQFSKDERRMYDAFQKDAQLRVNVMTGQRERVVGGKTYIHILQAILRLRLFCTGGKDLMSENDLRLLEGSSSEAPIAIDSDDDDEKPALTENKAYDMFNLMKDTNGDNCIVCNQKLGSKEGSEIESERQEDLLGHMTPCFHLICTSCIKGFQGACPCGDTFTSTFALRSGRAGQEPEAQEQGGNANGKTLKDYGGPNTKVKYLINELKKWKQKGLEKPDEPPYKSVVFSQWTTNMDLIQRALENEGITFTRLDGKLTRNARTRAMDSFRDDPDVQVILVSIYAGGLGLNLTAGNSVYIMEPLFNPAAEAQAVDRVHRLGQKREVFCVRLLMEDSFEEKMRELQEKKMKLASLSMDREKGDGSGLMTKNGAAKQRLMDLRSLFDKNVRL